MTASAPSTDARLLLVSDLGRLGPIVAETFAPQRIDGVHTYLDAIAEIPRSPTQAVLVAFDPSCRKPESALRAMKQVAGQDTPVIFCCEPAYENVGRRVLEHGADGYVIFPPDSLDLEAALGMASARTQQHWIETPIVAPAPSVEELARLADLLPKVVCGASDVLHEIAALMCAALRAESAVVTLDGRTGRAGHKDRLDFKATLIEPIERSGKRIGQIRIGPSLGNGYSHEDTAKLRHYAVLFGRMLEGAAQTKQWQDLALVDDLTGLPNRRRLIQFLEETLATAAQSRMTVTALVFDIDDFKRYNDFYGHDAGDEILNEVGKLFVECSRKTDLVARYGGDEFVVVFWDPEGPRTAGSRPPDAFKTVVQRFRQGLRNHSFARLGPEAQGCLTISGGLAHFPWQGRTPAELIEAADQALLQAKRAGKNRFWVTGEGAIGV